MSPVRIGQECFLSRKRAAGFYSRPTSRRSLQSETPRACPHRSSRSSSRSGRLATLPEWSVTQTWWPSGSAISTLSSLRFSRRQDRSSAAGSSSAMIVMVPDCGGIPAAYVKSTRGTGGTRGPSAWPGRWSSRASTSTCCSATPGATATSRWLTGSGRSCTCPIRGPRPPRSSSPWWARPAPWGSSPPRLRPRPTTTSASTPSCGTCATMRSRPRARQASPRWRGHGELRAVCPTQVDLHRLSLCGLDDARSRPVPRTMQPADEHTIAAGELPLRPGHAASRVRSGRRVHWPTRGWSRPRAGATTSSTAAAAPAPRSTK
jgi:hypothetical protein